MSHPVRGAWIEIPRLGEMLSPIFGSHPVRGAWIEIPVDLKSEIYFLSHPVRGAWIEIGRIRGA